MAVKKAPKFAKYSVSIMSLRHTLDFPNEPNPEWHKTTVLVKEKDITRLFGEFKIVVGNDPGPKSLEPMGWEGKARVYFNPKDKNSLFLVAESRLIADDYAEENGLRRPFNEPKERPRVSGYDNWIHDAS